MVKTATKEKEKLGGSTGRTLPKDFTRGFVHYAGEELGTKVRLFFKPYNEA